MKSLVSKLIPKLIPLIAVVAVSCGGSNESFNSFFGVERDNNSQYAQRRFVDMNRGQTSINLLLVDSATGDLVKKTARVKVEGVRATAFTDAAGNSYENYYTTSGQLKLTMARGERPPVPPFPVALEFTVHVDGYLIGSSSLELDSIGSNNIQINMVNPHNPPAGVTTLNDTSGFIINDELSGDLELTTPVDPETGTTTSFTLPAGTTLTDENGEPLSGRLTSTVAFFNNKNVDSLLSFPGGFDAELAVDETGASSQALFISAGFAAIEIQDSTGRVATNFSQDAQLTIDSSATTLNPETGMPIAEGDTIPIWSLDEETGWSYEGEGSFVNNNDGTFSVTKPLNHLSYWNLDWKSDYCSQSRTINIIGNDGRSINYIMTRVGGGWAKNFNDSDNSIVFFRAPSATPMRLEAFSDGKPVGALDIDDLCGATALDLILTLPTPVDVPVTVRAECTDATAGNFGQVDNNINSMLSYKYLDCASGSTSACSWKTTNLNMGSVNLLGLIDGGNYTLSTSYESPDTGEVIPVTHSFLADGTVQNLVIPYCAGTNTELIDISLSNGVMTPTFDTNVLAYSTEVSTNTIQITAVSRDPSATITINNVATTSGQPVTINIGQGKNVPIVVQSADGLSQQTYSVLVNQISSNATLTSLLLSAGALEPVFQTDTLDYSASVPLGTSAITITPTAFKATALITVNGTAVASGTASQSIPLNLGETLITILVTAPDGKTQRTYTVTITRGFDVSGQEAYFKASNNDNSSNIFMRGDLFGYSLAISGDTMAVGAPYESSSATGVNGNQNDNSLWYSGAVYVFNRINGAWVQQAYIKASNTDQSDFFGWSLDLSGDTLVVGAPYERSSATGVNGNQNDNSLFYSGAAYVFTRSGTTWSQQAYLKASNTDQYDYFGWDVAIDGDNVVVGTPYERSSATGINGNQNDNSLWYSGAAYVFTRSGTTWSQQAYLKASNTDQYDHFGRSVAISGNTIAIGALGESSGATGVNGNQNDNSILYSGAAYIFTRSGTTWSQQAYLKASNPGQYDYFGWSIDISGDTVVIGAPYEDSSATGVNGNQSDDSLWYSGAAYVYSRSGTTWSQQAYLKASNTGQSDQFGRSVGISGDTVVVGAPFERSGATGINGNQSDDTILYAGAAYLYNRSGTAWSQQLYIKASNSDFTDYFGMSVDLSGDTVAIGAPYESSSATGVNGDQLNNDMPYSGAVYTFR